MRSARFGRNVTFIIGFGGEVRRRLTLRQHPVAFLRKDLPARNIMSCAEAMNARDGRWVYTAGLVLVRQKPGSAKGVMFITIEDETGRCLANPVRKATAHRAGILNDGDQGPDSAGRGGRASGCPAALRPVRGPRWAG